MNVKDIVEKFKLTPLYLTEPQKKYVYACSLTNAMELKKDFIFLPFITYESPQVYETLKKVIKNPYCKGFIISEYTFKTVDKKLFHLLMKTISRQIEVFVTVPNLYKVAQYIAIEKNKKYKSQIISIIGVQQTSTVREVLASSLEKNNFNFTSSTNENGMYKKICEPIMLIDEDTDYSIIEYILEKRQELFLPSMFEKNHYLFTDFALNYMGVWETMENLEEEILKTFKKPSNILSIYATNKTEFIEENIPYYLTEKFHRIKTNDDLKFEQDFYYLNSCYSLAYEFLKNNNINPILPCEFIEQNPLYTIKNFKNNEFFVLNKNRINYKNVFESLKVFFEKYKDKKKIIILKHIIDMCDNYKESAYRELLFEIAKNNPDVLIFLELSHPIYLFKKHNHTTYLKDLSYKGNENDKLNLKIFLDGVMKEDCAVYIEANANLSFLYEEGLE